MFLKYDYWTYITSNKIGGPLKSKYIHDKKTLFIFKNKIKNSLVLTKKITILISYNTNSINNTSEYIIYSHVIFYKYNESLNTLHVILFVCIF